jgi:glutamate--cysteine ligase
VAKKPKLPVTLKDYILLDNLQQRIAKLSQPKNIGKLKGIRRGIEKESLRIDQKGQLAQTDHAKSLGSKLTSPSITTDYSEALLEFITPALVSPDQALAHLDDVHRFTYSQIEEELLWTSSMPCLLPADNDIRLADYGISNIAKMKTIYREGLGNRYGRSMQTIAGIHYNFSMPDSFWEYWHQEQQSSASLQDFKTESYFALIRNFHRYSWLLLYLFGASPALCQTFLHDKQHNLQTLHDGTLYQPYATSLRMGDLGYQSDAQENLLVCYNYLSTYIESLHEAITAPHSDYQAIGLKDAEGNYKQLNTALLQIENEFYSTIRPKRTIASGEAALNALLDRGIEYIEVRALDLNPYLPLGLDKTQMRFLDTFLTFCLLEPSPLFDLEECTNNKENLAITVTQGRDPNLTLTATSGSINLRQWAADITQQMKPVADLLDLTFDTEEHNSALDSQQQKVNDSSLTPSEQILDTLIAEKISFHHFSMKQAENHAKHFGSRPLDEVTQQQFVAEAKYSWQQQSDIEANDSENFDTFLAAYYRQYNRDE